MSCVKPFDGAMQAATALHGFMQKAPERLLGSEGYYRPVFKTWILPPRIGHDQWDWGDCTSRAILAFIALREMTGNFETGREVEKGHRALLLSLLNPETGLAFVPDLAYPAEGKHYYHVWDQGRTLRALVRWYNANPEDRERLRPYIQRMIRGLENYATIRGVDPVWGPYRGWPSDSFVNNTPEERVGWVNMRVGLLIEPLAMWAALTGDENALELAVEFTNCELGGHQGDGVPPDAARRDELADLSSETDFRFGNDGSFTGHFHTKSATLLGIVKTAQRLANDGRLSQALAYLRRTRTIYDWIFAPHNENRGSRIGWFPEQLFPRRVRVVGETCCTADMIELAAALASCHTLDPELSTWANLYDEVEAMMVNTIARSQFTITPEYEALVSGMDLDPDALARARRLEGTWAACCYPNDLAYCEQGRNLEIFAMACCQYAGVRGLYSGWREAVSYDGDTLRINFFTTRQSPEAVMESQVPQAGRAWVALRKRVRLQVRAPIWLEPSEIRMSRDGQALMRRGIVGSYLDLGMHEAGATINIDFPLRERDAQESIGGNNRGGKSAQWGYCSPDEKLSYSLRWCGNYLAHMRPKGAHLAMFG